MKEMLIRVPEESVAFVEELLQKIGGDVTEIKKPAKHTKNTFPKKQPKPLDFFGTWLDIDLDPKTYRKKLWRKDQRF
jgi:hypothetical protein